MWPLVGKPHGRAGNTSELAGLQMLGLMRKEKKQDEMDNREVEEDEEGKGERVIMGVAGRRWPYTKYITWYSQKIIQNTVLKSIPNLS